jgi:hypothetical protein
MPRDATSRPPPVQDIPDLAALWATVRALQQAVQDLQQARSPGPRDRNDGALIVVIATASRGLPFTSPALWRHRRVDPELASAFEAADLDTAQQLGKLLRRLAGADVNGYTIRQLRVVTAGRDRGSAEWQVQHTTQE